MSDRFNADIPGLAFDQAFVYFAVKQSLGLCDLIHKTCGGQDLRQQRVRIKRNGRQHLIEFISVES
jgi:hypothetical protein